MRTISSLVIILFGCALLGLSREATAQSSPSAELWRRGQVIAPGQSQFTFSTNFSKFSDRRTSAGGRAAIGSAYTQAISWDEIIGGAAGPEKVQLQSYLSTQGLDLSSSAASTRLEVTQELLNLSPQWAYGLTDFWMVGVKLPLVYKRTQIETKTELSKEFSSLLAQAESDSQRVLPSDVNLRAKQALDEKLQSYNYDPIQEDQKEWVVGDVELLSKVRVWQSTETLVALRQRVSLPTASSKSPYQYVESPSGDGQLDIGLDAVVDYWVAPGWILTGAAGYTWQASDQIRARLPADASLGEASERPTNVSGDVDYEVDRNLGDYISASMYAENILSSRWKLLGGYSYKRKAEDSYRGGGYSSERYEALARESNQELHMAHLGLNFQAEPFYERYGLKRQIATSFYLSSVVAGINVPDTTLAGLDFQLFF